MSTPTAVENLFLAALARTDAGARAAFLDDACGGDAELRRRVDLLLDAHERAGDFLERPAVATGPTTDADAEGPGTRVGPYKLLQKLGEGGMGVVWVAEQTQPVKRRVALKLVKPGMDSRQVIARFEAERQALALMDHPNIARVLDAGTTDTGLPYFVMELVKGVPITRYCDELQLSIRERLGLFVGVCQAVQHAHTKGVLHRDLKPSNVLVAIQDGRAVPKVIDFGVAKALNQRLTDRTLMTEFGAVVGTLEYMSPEQAELSALDVDTRADVYCLGVLLYELLTGTTPVTRQRLKQAAFDEALRIIREEEPPKPSTRLTESKESLAALAALRKTEPRKLGAEIAGELDWIVMRCLEKDRSRRYETATGLARDVERHLNGEAVEACPPSVGYRMRKFARRYRRALVTAGVLAVMLVLATFVSIRMAVRAKEALRNAHAERAMSHQARNEAEKAKKKADEEAASAKAFADFIRQHLLEQKAGEGGPNLPLKAVLDEAQKHLDKLAGKDPAQEAAVRRSFATAYLRIGEHDAARRHLERALALLEKAHGPGHVDTCEPREELAKLHSDRGDYDRALELFEKSIAIRKRENRPRRSGPDEPLIALARAYGKQGRYADGAELLARAVAHRRERDGKSHWDTYWARHYQAILLTYQRKYREALNAADEQVEAVRWEPKAPNQLFMAKELQGWCYLWAGKFEQASKILSEVVAGYREQGLGNTAELANVLEFQADALIRLNRFDEAEPLLRESLKIRDRGPKGWQRFWVVSQIGGVLLHRKDYANAEKLLREGYEGMKVREKSIEAPHRYNLREALDRLIAAYEATGKKDEAERRRKELKALPASAARGRTSAPSSRRRR